jgi:glycosyltransferase involved in cell wall biosynthesis
MSVLLKGTMTTETVPDRPAAERDGAAQTAATRASTERPHVCFISQNLYGLLYPASGLEFGGAEVQVLTLAKALRQHGVPVSVLAGDGREARRDTIDGVAVVLDPHIGGHLRPPGPAPETAWDRYAARTRAWLDRRPPWVASTVRGLVRGLYACRRWVAAWPPVAALIFALRERGRVRRWVEVFRPVGADIYVTRCSGGNVGYMERACRKLGAKFVYMVAHEYDVSGEYGRTNGAWGRQYERGLRRADLVICQHRGQQDLLRRHYRRDGQVIRSLCPLPVRPGPRQAERRIVLWVARLEPWKRPELIVDLARRLPQESFVMVAPPTRLDRDYSARIEAEVAALPNLRLVPGVPFAEITALFEDAKVFVNTSHYEGFPNTFLQAAACGTPIVSWAVNPEGLLNREGIGYCAEQNPAKFEADVRRLCETPALREELGENGQRYVAQHHDPVRIAQDYAGLFAELMASARWSGGSL